MIKIEIEQTNKTQKGKKLSTILNMFQGYAIHINKKKAIFIPYSIASQMKLSKWNKRDSVI